MIEVNSHSFVQGSTPTGASKFLSYPPAKIEGGIASPTRPNWHFPIYAYYMPLSVCMAIPNTASRACKGYEKILAKNNQENVPLGLLNPTEPLCLCLLAPPLPKNSAASLKSCLYIYILFGVNFFTFSDGSKLVDRGSVGFLCCRARGLPREEQRHMPIPKAGQSWRIASAC